MNELFIRYDQNRQGWWWRIGSPNGMLQIGDVFGPFKSKFAAQIDARQALKSQRHLRLVGALGDKVVLT